MIFTEVFIRKNEKFGLRFIYVWLLFLLRVLLLLEVKK